MLYNKFSIGTSQTVSKDVNDQIYWALLYTWEPLICELM